LFKSRGYYDEKRVSSRSGLFGQSLIQLKQNVYSYSNDTLKFKDYRKVIDKALSMGLEIDYLDMTELHDIGDTGFAIGGYP